VSDPPTLLFASTNSGKLREVRAILFELPLRLQTLEAYPEFPPAVEDGETFEANARKKALHYAQRAGTWTLADDSGLEVDALGGDPGVHSARFAGPDANDAANNALLIHKLVGVPESKRTARFRCVMALADPREAVAVAEGAVEGIIHDAPRGANGFGYDPHFYVPRLGMTTAELPPETKNRISHRGQALARIRFAIVKFVLHRET